MYKSHIKTPNSLIVVTEVGSFSLAADHPKFSVILGLINEGKFELIEPHLSAKGTIEKATNKRFRVVDGYVVYGKNDEKLPKYLSETVIKFAQNGCDYDVILKFWDRVRMNPSKVAQNELYLFLESGHFPITKDGKFIAYKRVDENFLDHHSHSFDNRPGKTPSMNREDCDPNREQTCSNGLHVANWNYAWGFASGHMIEVLVDPKDVVSVPSDHSNAKMRVCRYHVLREVTAENQEIIYTQPVKVEPPKVINESKTCKLPSNVVTVGNRNRLRVPTEFISALKHKGFVYVYASEEQSKLIVSGKNVKNATKYAVDDHSIKIAESLLKLLTKTPKYFKIVFDKEEMIIKITKFTPRQ